MVEVTKTGHSTYRLQYHVVWVCKYRRRILNPGVVSYLKKVLAKLVRQMSGVSIEELGADGDHIHMLMVIPPKFSIAAVMGELKSKSASKLRTKYPHLEKVYWKENIVWSPGYFVSSVGLTEKVIKNYVKQQGNQDSGQLTLKL